MAVTLKQIAEMAGVHKSTVDKVIHNRPGVSDEVRLKIRRLLEEQGYSSNPLAKALNYQKNKMSVAVVLTRVDALEELQCGIQSVQPDYDSFNLEIQYHVLDYADEEAQRRCLRELCRSDVSGVVIGPVESPAIAQEVNALEEAGIPTVTLNSDLEGSHRLCFVGCDELKGGRATARLMSLLLARAGQIGILTSTIPAVRERTQGFVRHIQDRFPGILAVDVLNTNEDAETAYQLTCDLLHRQPQLDGLFIACGCVPDICRAVRDCGRAGQLTVVCFERYPAIVELVHQGEVSCTISGSLFGQGQRAMRLLFEYLVYGKPPEQERIYLSNEILLAENID